MGKNHAQNTHTIWPERPSPTENPGLINNLWISNETSRTIVQRTVFNTLSLNPARVLSKRIRVRNEDHRTADSFHAITGNQPGTRSGKITLTPGPGVAWARAWPILAPRAGELELPGADPPRATTGAPGALPENLKVVSFAPNSRTTTAIEWSHPPPSPGGYLADAPGCLRDSPRRLPESRDAWAPAAWPARAAEAGQR